MPITAIGTVATGDTITANWGNTVRDNVNLLDGRTGGDPGAASKVLVSNGSTGGSWAAEIPAGAIPDDAVTAAKIAAGAVGTTELADGAVTNAKLGANSVGTSNIADGNVTTAKIADGNVTGTKISSAAGQGVATANINDLAVTAAKLASDAVTTAKIADGNVTGAKISSAAGQGVATANINDSAVTTAKLADANVTGAKISTTAGQRVSTNNIDDGAITEGKLASGAAAGNLGFTPARIAASSYTGDGTSNRTIPLSFTPKLVWVHRPDTVAYWRDGSSKAVEMGLVAGTVNSKDHPAITTNGFIVDGTVGNTSGATYYYVAFG